MPNAAVLVGTLRRFRPFGGIVLALVPCEERIPARRSGFGKLEGTRSPDLYICSVSGMCIELLRAQSPDGAVRHLCICIPSRFCWSTKCPGASGIRSLGDWCCDSTCRHSSLVHWNGMKLFVLSRQALASSVASSFAYGDPQSSYCRFV